MLKGMAGLFVTFEGIDGSGKSTQMRLCAEALSAVGQQVIVTRNPGGTDFGQELRHILLHSSHPVAPISELLLFIADRAQHMSEVVFPAMADGAIVLCDRHLDSTVAYQGYGRGLSLETIHMLNNLAIQGRKPDITFVFDGDPEALATRVDQRGTADRLEGESLIFRTQVREGFLALAAEEPERIIVLDALQELKTLHQQVMTAIQKRL